MRRRADSQFWLSFPFRFVLITDPTVPSLRECLKQIYTHIYVEHVIKNPVKGGRPVYGSTHNLIVLHA